LLLGAIVAFQLTQATHTPTATATGAPTPVATSSPGILIATPSALAMNPAQQRTIVMSGATLPISVTSQQRLVRASVSQNVVTVDATQATGNDVIRVKDAAGSAADVPVRVAFNAGTIASSITLNVTGNPVDPAWLSEQVVTAVKRASPILPGATISLVVPPSIALIPGATTSIAVPVTMNGNGEYFDQSGTTDVTVAALPLVPLPPTLLFYDDDPEDVDDNGLLYQGIVTAAQRTRLYTYHEDTGGSMWIAVVLSAVVPSRVQIVDAAAGPSIDVMSVGHAATLKYLSVAPAGEGVVLNVDPQSPLVVHDTQLDNGDVIAEATDIRVLSGGPVTVSVLSLSAGQNVVAALDATRVAGDGHRRDGVFSLDGRDPRLSYFVGGPDASVTYGARDDSPQNVIPDSPGRDHGDYGVLHSMVFTLDNPTDSPGTAYLYERPLGGDVRSSFLVDGSLLQLGCAREPERYQIAAYLLAPHSTYQVSVETMPDGGSNYPLEIGIGSEQPHPTTPPIHAPDGCFPSYF
jgi:hypothetical protein